MAEPALALVKVEKSFEKVRAVDKVSLEVGTGEFFSLLGPSGAGKTTILKAIAGLIEPSYGDIRINGNLMNGLPPDKRDAPRR